MDRDRVAAVDLSAMRIWPPKDCQKLESWYCRIDEGVTRRANSVLALGGQPENWRTLVEEAERRYRAAGRVPVFQITPAAGGAVLDERLAELGYRLEAPSSVQERSIENFTPANEPLGAVELGERPLPGWLDLYCLGESERARLAKAAILDRVEGPSVFGAAGPAAARWAVGAAFLDGERGWINCMNTHPDHRRKGLAFSLIQHFMKWMAGAGGKICTLQVEVSNPGANKLYRSSGFQEIYRYHYRIAPKA